MKGHLVRPLGSSESARGSDRREPGQAALLIVGLFLVSVLVVGVVVDASAAYLRKQSLGSLAEGAALAAAGGVQGEQVYAGGLGERALIDPTVARQHAADYLVASGAHREFPGLRLSVDASADEVFVRVEAPLRLPIPLPGSAGGTTVAADASSVVLLGG